MAHLIPFPFGRLVTRVLDEAAAGGAVLDLPRDKVVRGAGGRDWSTRLFGHEAATPLGPAAGPHTQLAQNIVLGYLGGCRVFELKTVQVMDELSIPRPCIDLRTVGFNVEWSQELKLEESLEEYVKASMLLELLSASGHLGLDAGFERFVFDLSVGYDLAGVQSEAVRAFLSGMLDATAIVEKLRAQIPAKYGALRELPFRTCISDSLTLSTFHGCPPGEIEGLARFLMEQVGLNVVVKLNPTLLGPTEARGLFNEQLGYRYRIPDSAFTHDPSWAQAMDLVGRLEQTAKQCGRGLGVKFSNTLVVENEGDFLPKSEKLAYLSGQPLHVLAMTLVGKFRGQFGDRLPVSFSAGIDRQNFADAVALGLKPVTVCSDLLRPQGYGRLHGYFGELGARMDQVGARTLDEWVLLGRGQAVASLEGLRLDASDHAKMSAAVAAKAGLREAAGSHWEAWLSHARLRNTTDYVGTLATNPRYAAAANAKAPTKVGTKLALFDCLTCDKCVPVCPNHANFTFELPKVTLPVRVLTRSADGWLAREGTPLVIAKKHQIGNFADFCNECGNCDIFCPEDGGPYAIKPRFFGSIAQFDRWVAHDGFHVDGATVRGRFGGKVYRLVDGADVAAFAGPGFDVLVRGGQSVEGTATPGTEVDLTWFHVLRWMRAAVQGAQGLNYVNA